MAEKGKNLFSLLLLLSALFPFAAPQSLNFSGFDWLVRDSDGLPAAPGPNIFSADNAYVDGEGKLHFKLTKGRNNVWRAAEVQLTKELGYGKYQFLFEQDLHHFGTHDSRGDPFVVFAMSLFNNPSQMIHFDFARWGETGSYSPNADVCVSPMDAPRWENCRGFIQIINYNRTLHTIDWQKDRLYFESLHLDHDNYGVYNSWEVEPKTELPDPEGMKLHINLFFLKGRPHEMLPLEEDLDIILSSFKFTPISSL